MRVPSEQTIILHTLSGEIKSESMLSLADKLIYSIGLQDWRGWFEPFPGASANGQFGRDAAFHPWTTKLPDADKTPNLAEIRIGGYLADRKSYAGCHLVQDDELGLRWFAFAEAPFKMTEKTSDQCEAVRRRYQVLQRSDAKARFFSEQPKWLNKAKLDLVEYWLHERIYAWLVAEVKTQGEE